MKLTINIHFHPTHSKPIDNTINTRDFTKCHMNLIMQENQLFIILYTSIVRCDKIKMSLYFFCLLNFFYIFVILYNIFIIFLILFILNKHSIVFNATFKSDICTLKIRLCVCFVVVHLAFVRFFCCFITCFLTLAFTQVW